jgi:DNA repair exonuclease SbcCD ATPase subunit
MLPGVNEEDTHGKTPRTQATHLREENQRLRREVEELQEQLATYQSSMDLLDNEIETIHRDHRQEIEQYQQHLREMMEERNQMQEVNQHWEQRYQDLYQSFQDAVEEEAGKMVKEAAQTLVLSPEHTPALLGDVVKTLEAQMRQTEDQRTAELLAVMRQAKYKSELLEQEMAHERNELAAERDNLRQLRESMHQQAQQRYQVERTRLQARWTTALMFTSLLMLCLLVTLETVFTSFGLAPAIAIFVPLGICMVLTYLIAHFQARGRISVQKGPVKKNGSAPKSPPAKKAAPGKK